MPANPDDLFSFPAEGSSALVHRSTDALAFSPQSDAAALFNAPSAMDLFAAPPHAAELFFDQRPATLEIPNQGRQSALACTSVESDQPFNVKFHIQISCTCGGIARPISVVAEDARGVLDSVEYITADDSGDDSDVAEAIFHGRCDICNATVCVSVVKPVARGTMGPIR